MATRKKTATIKEEQTALRAAISEAELVRERGDALAATEQLTAAAYRSLQIGDYLMGADALGHLIVCYKHLYKRTGNKQYLNLMALAAGEGEILCQIGKLPSPVQGMFRLRSGDCSLELLDYDTAAQFYYEAVRLVGKRNQARYAEYVSHYGFALGMMGGKKGAYGLRLLQQAKDILEKDTTLREFHRLTVLCGILIRTVLPAQINNDLGRLDAALTRAKDIAMVLRDKHRMPGRLKDVKEAAKGVGWKV